MAIIAHGTSPRPVRPGPWAVAIALEWEYGIPGPKSTAGRSILSGRELFNHHFYRAYIQYLQSQYDWLLKIFHTFL